MYFWLNYPNKNNPVERIPTAVKNTDYLFCKPSEILEFDQPHQLLLFDSTRISDNKTAYQP